MGIVRYHWVSWKPDAALW